MLDIHKDSLIYYACRLWAVPLGASVADYVQVSGLDSSSTMHPRVQLLSGASFPAVKPLTFTARCQRWYCVVLPKRATVSSLPATRLAGIHSQVCTGLNICYYASVVQPLNSKSDVCATVDLRCGQAVEKISYHSAAGPPSSACCYSQHWSRTPLLLPLISPDRKTDRQSSSRRQAAKQS